MHGRGPTQFHRVAARLVGENGHTCEVLVVVRAEECGTVVEDEVHAGACNDIDARFSRPLL
jgi:hypothetical protein